MPACGVCELNGIVYSTHERAFVKRQFVVHTFHLQYFSQAIRSDGTNGVNARQIFEVSATGSERCEEVSQAEGA
jgi:hypothetical protein